jgi:hypothetical protein
MTLAEFLAKLSQVQDAGDHGHMAACPAHDDQTPSLSVGVGDDGRILLHCFAGCEPEAIVKALDLTVADLFPSRAAWRRRAQKEKKKGGSSPVEPAQGCTLAQYAHAKRLPVDFLRSLGLQDMTYMQRPAIRIPYRNVDGQDVAVQFRLSLTGADRFRWRKGSTPCLYALWRIKEVWTRTMVVLCEGPSDVQTLWFHHIPALGLPSATGWKDAWVPLFDGIATIYVVLEPDQGGEAVLKAIGASKLRNRVRLITLPPTIKDPSALYLADPPQFIARWLALVQSAVPWGQRAARQRQAAGKAAWAVCQSLAQTPRILDALAVAIERRGVVGELRAAQLLYLIVCSRLLDHPVSAAVKGPSSAGKSYVEQHVLEFFPPSAYYTLTGMSERALAYSAEPLQHRVLVVYEMAGLQSDFASYLVRSLLSEGQIRYETVVKTPEGPKPLLIEREGPTSLIVTTTAIRLHPENETRLLSIPVDDTPAQTRRILDAVGRHYNGGESSAEAQDVARWHALQEWLATAEPRVTIPFAKRLVAHIPPAAVRLRRDIPAVLRLVQAHALLHQATRSRDATGHIVATLADYKIVRELVADLIAEGIERGVSDALRQTVETAAKLLAAPGTSEVTISALARALHMDYPAVHRRVRQAMDRGFLKNFETRKGLPARLALGEALPKPTTILPMPDALLAEGGKGACNPPKTPSTHQPPPGSPTKSGLMGCTGDRGISYPPLPPVLRGEALIAKFRPPPPRVSSLVKRRLPAVVPGVRRATPLQAP